MFGNEWDSFGGVWVVRTNVSPKGLGKWLLEDYNYYGTY